ncbi:MULTISPECIES: DUF397 domain-containing protein [unclassified Streptomyces]|uniref:DUF397 domain-containing protein n=1 Tax=unclassified Streptomyces TaxID=2593676 RepID=UPI000A849D7A|nr:MULTISPECIES: DUF397 domain-containing protein [unclassified Streptomyces]AZM62633.1 DUF397 domain-containing protein [Streptomyces sp. WAC 01438]RSM89869.1 DUF397 domain-containing protein [Streptomyces sp. WAC 01420]
MSHETFSRAITHTAIWRRSSYSGGQGDCLELAHNIPALAPVRDSKNPTGPVIAFGRSAWGAFLARLR